MRPVAALLATVLLAGCSQSGAPAGSAVPMPNPGQTPAIGVSYRATTTCGLAILIGDAYWKFVPTDKPWPPPLPQNEGTTPYPIPGVIWLTSPTTAVFRADSNGQELQMVSVGPTNPDIGTACL